MRFRNLPVVCLFAIPSLSWADPVIECRDDYGTDPAAHIACLESAIRSLQGKSGEDPAPPQKSAGQASRDESTPTSGAKPVTPPVAAAATGLGSEQVRENSPAAERDEQEVSVLIVATSYNSRGLGTFRMQDGQVWRETTASPERKRLDTDKQYTARIERARFGGYRMYVEGVRWMKTVERLQ